MRERGLHYAFMVAQANVAYAQRVLPNHEPQVLTRLVCVAVATFGVLGGVAGVASNLALEHDQT